MWKGCGTQNAWEVWPYGAWEVLKRVLSNRGLGMAKKCLYEGVIVPTALYGAEAYGMSSAERRNMNVLEMKCLRSLVGVWRMDGVRNDEVRRRAGIERELASRADQGVLRWFGNVERMDAYCMARRVLIAEVNRRRVRGRPRLGCMDGVKVALEWRWRLRITARTIGKSGEAWYICNWINFTWAFLFVGTVFFRTALPCSRGYHLDRGGMPLHDAVGIICKKVVTTENQGAGVTYMD